MSVMAEMFSLHGRNALVTGASGGIGASIARILADAGAAVAVHCRSHREEAQTVVGAIRDSGGNAWLIEADITDSAQVASMFEMIRLKWGRLDILVNNAGAHVGKSPLEQVTDESIAQTITTNLIGAVYVTRSAIPLLRAADQAAIVNISSIAAISGGSIGSSLYAAAKGGLDSFTRSLAKELAPHIRVNAVAPAAVPTGFHHGVTSEKRWRELEQAVPLKRLGAETDTASAVLFLVGKGAGYITGQVWQISGGRDLSF